MKRRAAPSAQDKIAFQNALRELQGGSPREAIRLFDLVRKSWGDDPDIWYLIGLAHGKLGEYQDVKRVSLLALDQNPSHHNARTNLANAQMALGEQREALENYRKAASAKPDDPTILNNYGRALGSLGKREVAMEQFEKALRMNPGHGPAHASLGQAYQQAGLPEKAMASFRKALAIEPRLAEAHLGIGQLLSGVGGLAEAERHLRDAIRLDPYLIPAYLGLSQVLRYQGQYDRALEAVEKAEANTANDPHLLATKADILERMGEHQSAWEILTRLREEDRLSPFAVAVYSRICHHFDTDVQALDLIQASIEAPETDLVGRQALCFAAGTLLDKLGRHDDAFPWFQKANQSITTEPYVQDAQRKQTDRIMESFSRERLATLPRAKTNSTLPIFILGMPRSGTSLAEQIIASHPDVHGGGELGLITDLANELDRITPDGLDETILTGMADRYLRQLQARNAGKKHVTDKMPHNFLHIGLINLLFPGARIIHCRRNALDNGLSIYFQSFIWTHHYATDLGNIGLFYREYQRLMQHWEDSIDIPMLTLDYEDMVENTEDSAHKILEFCGLDWDESVMQFHTTKRSVATASYNQVRQPIYKTSRDRWRNYACHIAPLQEALGINPES